MIEQLIELSEPLIQKGYSIMQQYQPVVEQYYRSELKGDVAKLFLAGLVAAGVITLIIGLGKDLLSGKYNSNAEEKN